MGLLLIANLWLMAYYTYKRYHVRQELERSVYGREHLEDFGEYVAGSMDIGAPGTFKRRMHDFIVRSTDAAFRFLHLQIPGEAALARLRAEAEGVSKSPTGTEKVAPPPLTERERIDRRSMDADLMRAREAQLVADTMGITGEQFAAENGAEVLRAASGDLRGRRGSILRVNGIEVGVTYGSPRRPSMSGVDRTPSGNLERAPSGNLDRVQSGGTESVVGAAGPESPGLLVPPEMTVTVPTLQRKDTA
ncbi:hypothetical protein DFJ74DRAFT_692288 [Hyaloraphidium curvatum]|nr:hypothetical protein DFJ74DRAFT_692288 [Hyaloraphidium curvatum]